MYPDTWTLRMCKPIGLELAVSANFVCFVCVQYVSGHLWVVNGNFVWGWDYLTPSMSFSRSSKLCSCRLKWFTFELWSIDACPQEFTYFFDDLQMCFKVCANRTWPFNLSDFLCVYALCICDLSNLLFFSLCARTLGTVPQCPVPGPEYVLLLTALFFSALTLFSPSKST